MVLKLYNTLTRSKDGFTPIDANNVRMYVCGPTVYDFAHIGNARPVIVFDVLFRLLRHIYGEKHVTYVRNITDVDDKINARALRDFPDLPLNDAIAKVTSATAAQFHQDVAALGCLPPTHEPRATEHIQGMIEVIEKLITRGHAYNAGGEVLFDVRSMPAYGALSGRDLDANKAGARVAVDAHKRDAADFVLWKLSSADEPGWESPWGRGRPGWHIECSAMSKAFLGETFDIHGGGLDLIFPHHENEIAQSTCASGHAIMANTWMHNGFVQVEGKKMSKSEGNFITIFDGMGDYHAAVARLTMLKTHYLQPLDWTRKGLQDSCTELLAWAKIVEDNAAGDETSNLADDAELISKDVLTALSDDLNTPAAITYLRKLASESEQDRTSAIVLFKTLKFLGFQGLSKPGFFTPTIVSPFALSPDEFHSAMNFRNYSANGYFSEAKSISADWANTGIVISTDVSGYIQFADLRNRPQISELVSARNTARAAKNWLESDRIRNELAAQGIVLKDNKDGTTTWEVKR